MLLLKNCKIVNYDKIEEGNIYIKDNIIFDISKTLEDYKNIENSEIIDCSGKIVIPALIDMHSHFRDPGYEYKEDIESGSRAALAGGYFASVLMANTKPACDSEEIITYIVEKAKRTNLIDIYPAGCITINREGQQIVEMGEMIKAGAVCFSDDGACVMNSEVARRALEYAKSFDSFILSHAEDINLSEGGQINEGDISTITGLKGIPSEAEEIMIAREILLTKLTKSHTHICHVSTEKAVELIKWAKDRNINVTCEVTPHHLTFTDEKLMNYETTYKMNPPLRKEKDIETLIQGIKEGIVDVIATDHAPHHIDEKYIEFEQAAFGITGLQTTIPLILSLIKRNLLDIKDLVRLTSYNPAKILNLKKVGKVEKNYLANITIIDPHRKYIFDEKINKSKSINSPLFGQELEGLAVYTIRNGNICYAIS